MGSRFFQCVLNQRNDNSEEFESHCARFIKFGEKLPDRVRGIAFQEEKGDGGTPHLQIHVELTSTTRANAVKRILGCEYLHVERARSRAASHAYCTKEDTREKGPWEFGDLGNQQGKRTDVEALKDAIDQGDGDADLWDGHFGAMLRYHKAVGVYRLARMSGQRAEPRVRCYHGPPGTGKTHRAFREAGELGTPFFPSLSTNSWFDGYDGHSPIIIDDFYDQYDVNFMKRLLDKYPMQVPVKGGFIPFTATDIWITSNHPPAEWWLEGHRVKNVDRQAVVRRIHEVEYMDEVYKPE